MPLTTSDSPARDESFADPIETAAIAVAYRLKSKAELCRDADELIDRLVKLAEAARATPRRA